MLVTEKGFNNNLTENWVAYAKSPSDFPNFAQIEFFSSEILGLPKISRKNPTSLNCDVMSNSEFGLEEGAQKINL